MAWCREWTGGVNRAAAPAIARASPGASDRKASPLAEAHPDFLAGLWLRVSSTKGLKPRNDLLEGGFVSMLHSQRLKDIPLTRRAWRCP